MMIHPKLIPNMSLTQHACDHYYSDGYRCVPNPVDNPHLYPPEPEAEELEEDEE